MNFGEVISAAQIMKRTISLVNTGNVMTHFRLRSATGDEPTKTTFDWSFGKIKPGAKCDLTAEILTDGCDIIEEKFDIHVTNSKKDQEKIYSIWSKAKILEEEIVIRFGLMGHGPGPKVLPSNPLGHRESPNLMIQKP